MSANNLASIIANNDLKDQLKTLVLERINVMPGTMKLAIGTTEVNKQDIIRHVKDEDEVGQQMMEMELDYLRDLASGAVYA